MPFPVLIVMGIYKMGKCSYIRVIYSRQKWYRLSVIVNQYGYYSIPYFIVSYQDF